MKILMVCMGNICRSPMAEGIMKDVLKGSKQNILIDSAGTLDYHAGETPDVRAVKKAKEHGIDISSQRARAFTVEDFDNFDRIYVMDQNNYQEIIKKARSEADKTKVSMIMNEVYPGENIDVPDPYYGGIQGFEDVFQMLKKACTTIAEEL